ncbi:5-oxoprolinase subunit PxpA [Pelagibacterium luteolum]|uniref:UPF0271 protein n=1 Tax=Pelagibacterium luteolum TaxID=440168 RepID=A0A1G7ZB26_9HYPH|nr:5-oxoprolinase subunit PxpA [Pelagibacterium luteolum]SDH05310.1 UPF0271 protein [Pelagibacterium luteolum]
MIDLNADLGEGVADDHAMLDIVTSASIACGGHAGDATTMRAAIRAAVARDVRIGAHPAFVDRENFGRKRLALPVHAIVSQVVQQVAALDAMTRDEGGAVAYLKLHGALANMAAEDEELAFAIFAATAEHWPHMAIMVLAGSAQERAAEALDLSIIPEAYADRAYTEDGLLAARSLPGSVIDDPEIVVARCLRLAERGEIETLDGTVITTSARSICVHGDTPGVVDLARAIKNALVGAGHMKG